MIFFFAGLQYVLIDKQLFIVFPFVVSGVKRYVCSLYLDSPISFAFGLVSFDLCLCNSVTVLFALLCNNLLYQYTSFPSYKFQF